MEHNDSASSGRGNQIAVVTVNVSPKDTFLHLLAIITLYVSAASLLTLLFQLINVAFPDPLAQSYYYDASESILGKMRMADAALIVVFPVYILTTRFLNKTYAAQPERRNAWIRKWLVYFTLFIAAIVAIVDLIALIYNLLDGDMTVHFLLKALSVLAVAGSIFWYYLSDVRRNKTE